VSKALQRVFIVVFLIVDVVLVGAAIRHVNGTPPSSELTEAAAAPAPSATPTVSTPGADTTEPAQVPYDFDATEAVSLSASNDGTIIYGTRGRCADAPTFVTVSTNAGADFAPSNTGLTTTLAVRAANADRIIVVGTNTACDVKQVVSTDGGKNWTDAGAVDIWYPDPDDTSKVVSLTRTSQPAEGCVVTSISQVTPELVRVSCADGSVYGSGDAGKTWTALGRLDNIRVSTFLTPSSGFALARYNGCAANNFSTTDGGVSWTPGGCISGEPAQSVAATSSGLAAVVAGEVYVSADEGKSWSQP
jgi:photosystem II stability/assembly factor-like uncharacterized protein